MNREQFIQHIERTQKSLRRFLVALCCGDHQLADDLAQETLIKAYLSSEGFRQPEKFNAWIFKIAYHTFLNERRDSRSYADVEEADVLPSNDTSDATFRYQALYAALDKLPKGERTSVLLYYIEGYSIKEISEITEASQDAIKQHLSRGRNHLRGLLKDN